MRQPTHWGRRRRPDRINWDFQRCVTSGQKFSIPTINVVRRAEQVELLRKMGAEHVLNTSDPGFDASLGDLCHRFGASIGLDAVAGEMSARVLRAQPRGSRPLVYGALSLE